MTTVTTQTRTFDGNAEAIEAWNGVLFDKFCRYRHIVSGGLGIIGDAALLRHAPPPASRALDIGCGFGDSVRQIAERIGERGEVVGVDAAARFIDVAVKEASEAGIKNARFLVADVQFDDLCGPYDWAFSRFGTMFFINPVAAFRNIRRALKGGAPLVMTVWRRKDENPWVYDTELVVKEIVPLPPSTDQVTCGPGPFSMASADVVSAQLLAAGFGNVTFERFDTPIRIGDTLEDAVNFAMTLGPAGEVMRLAGDEGIKRKPQVIEALKKLLSPLVRPDGVFGAASTWIVSARAS
jgi:SAM-dependent methyltransferase